ncbi:hypothetical protein P148_SR1C00001G0623 [candidate division SR1 bacterium RAAC1_SR1_1]|nr:hypothetical protein P148_SR1C00001G0623 [candidate division SR1 bacterium RAAC1_SR1_1]
MNGYTFLALILGGAIGYAIFYFRFQHKDTVNHLRSSLKEANKELQFVQAELDEFTEQNTILKEEITKLLEKNDDLTDVVTELSKYYVHIKKAAEKTTELNKYLQEPDGDILEKIDNINKNNKESEEKKFF